MKELKTTTPGGVPDHYHLVYLDWDSGRGATTVAEDHTHELQFQPPVEAQVDPQTQQPLTPARPGGWEVVPAADGHTHTIIEYEIKPPKFTQEENEAVKEVLSDLKFTYENESCSLEKAKESDDFYHGKQWNDSTKRELEKLDRACLTINRTKKYVNEILGYQIQERGDVHFVPVEGGDQRVADLLNVVASVILEQCFYAREERKIFYGQTVIGRGVFNIYVDFEKNIEGDICVENFPFDQVHFGPFEKDDLSDCEVAVKHKMYSKSKLTELIGEEKAARVEAKTDLLLSLPKKEVYKVFATDQYAKTDNKKMVTDTISWFASDLPLLDLRKKEYRLIERWKKIYVDRWRILDGENHVFDGWGWKKKDLNNLKTIPGLQVIERRVTKYRITKICGAVLVDDHYPADLPDDDFFFMPVHAYRKRDGDYYGVVEDAKDPQREVNKRASQAIDIGNKMAAYGWFITEGMFPSPNEKAKFKRTSTAPGWVVTINDVNNKPVKEEGVKYPSEIVNLMEIASTTLQELIGISATPHSANEPGSIFMQAQKSRFAGAEFLFDNLMFVKKWLGRKMVSLIQVYYTPERIYRIVATRAKQQQAAQPTTAAAPEQPGAPGQPGQASSVPGVSQPPAVQIGGQDFNAFTMDEIVDLLRDSDLSKYDVAVTESQNSPTARQNTSMMLTEMARNGQQIPPELFIELSDLPEALKQKVYQALTMQAQSAQQAAQESQKSEIYKTLIARNILPPEVAQMVGLPPGYIQPTGSAGQKPITGTPL